MPSIRPSLAPLSTAFLMFLVACAPDASTAPDASQGAPASASGGPSAALAAASNGGGALIVSVYGPIFVFIASDPEVQLTTTLGIPEAGIATDCSGGSLVSESFWYRTLTTPSGKVLELAKAEDVTVLVWEGVYEPFTDFCDFYANAKLLAVGTADYVLTSNNYFSPGAPGPIKDLLRAQGEVTHVETGKQFHYWLRASTLATGNGTDKGFRNSIQLTPKR